MTYARLVVAAVVVVTFSLLALPSLVCAQTTSVTFLVLPEESATVEDETFSGIGLRRGLRSVQGIDFTHPVDLLPSDLEAPPDLFDARDSLDGIAELIQGFEGTRAREQASWVVDLFEANLVHVSRRELVDAHMLLALTYCVDGDEDTCAEGFAKVAAYRENFTYDIDRYPPDYEPLYSTTHEEVTNGPRADIEILTDPPGVEVFVDGRSYGPSPTIAGALPAGVHYVTSKTLGFQRTVTAVVAEAGEIAQVSVQMERERQYRLVSDNLDGIRSELGEPRTGQAIQSMVGYLPSNQVVFAVVGRSGADVELDLYLYDIRTRFLLNTVQVAVPPGQLESSAETAAQQLYEGVNLDGRVEAPDDDGDDFDLFSEWWFWAGSGAVLVGAVVLTVIVAGQGGDCPSGHQCGTAIIGP